MKQLRVPCTWLIHFLGYIVDVVLPIVKHLGDDEGTFPGWRELVRSFLMHPKHKVSFLKCSTSDIASVESMQILLINGRLNQSHILFFLQEISIFVCLFCFSF